MKILKYELVYLRPNGDEAKNAIFQNYDKDTREIIFYELIGFSGDNTVKGKKLFIDGQETYKRLFIQRVYPYMSRKKELKK